MFPLGQVVATPAALKAIDQCQYTPLHCILRHQRLEQGALGLEDHESNKQALTNGSRVFSSFELPTKQKVWVITEWDLSLTTLLLPDEY